MTDNRLQIRLAPDVCDHLAQVEDTRAYVEAVLRDRQREVRDAWSMLLLECGQERARNLIRLVLDSGDISPLACRVASPVCATHLHVVCREIAAGSIAAASMAGVTHG